MGSVSFPQAFPGRLAPLYASHFGAYGAGSKTGVPGQPGPWVRIPPPPLRVAKVSFAGPDQSPAAGTGTPSPPRRRCFTQLYPTPLPPRSTLPDASPHRGL